MDKAVEELERVKQRPVFSKQPLVQESKVVEREIMLVWAPMSAQSASTNIEELEGPYSL